jgi:hypothetical protein
MRLHIHLPRPLLAAPVLAFNPLLFQAFRGIIHQNAPHSTQGKAVDWRLASVYAMCRFAHGCGPAVSLAFRLRPACTHTCITAAPTQFSSWLPCRPPAEPAGSQGS